MPVSGTFTTNTTADTGRQGARSGTPYVTLAAKGAPWGAATVKLQAGFNIAGTLEFFDIADSALTADGVVSVAIAADDIRVSCTGGTGHSIKWAIR